MVRNSRGGYDSGDTPMDPSKMPKVPTGPAPGAMPKQGGYSGSLPADQVPPPPSTPSETIRPNRQGRKSGKTLAQEIALESHDVFGQVLGSLGSYVVEVCPSCLEGDHHTGTVLTTMRQGVTYTCLCPECVTITPKDSSTYPKHYGIKAAHEGSWYALAVLREHLKGLGPEQARRGETSSAWALRMVQHQAVKDALAAVEKAVYPPTYVNPAQPDRQYGESDHLTFSEVARNLRPQPWETRWPGEATISSTDSTDSTDDKEQ